VEVYFEISFLNVNMSLFFLDQIWIFLNISFLISAIYYWP